MAGHSRPAGPGGSTAGKPPDTAASASLLRRMATQPTVRGVALLLLCGAYLQGGLTKALDLAGAQAEMAHFGLQPALPVALATIALELLAPLLVLSGRGRWLGALGLAAFTAAASVLANPFWALTGPERAMATNAFFEHGGLVGGWLLVAWHDLAEHHGH